MGSHPAAYAALACSILLGAVGQLFLKSAAVAADGWLNPKLAAGLAVYVVSMALYVFALRLVPLGIAFPSVSLSYVLVAYGAHVIWCEPFGTSQVGGLILIAAGIFLVNR